MGVWDSLLYEGFSLAIGVAGTEALANTFSLDPLGSVRKWRFVMAADHPLANVEEPLTEAQLRRFPAVNIEDSARTLNQTRRLAIAGAKRDCCSRYGNENRRPSGGRGHWFFAKITLPVNAR